MAFKLFKWLWTAVSGGSPAQPSAASASIITLAELPLAPAAEAAAPIEVPGLARSGSLPRPLAAQLASQALLNAPKGRKATSRASARGNAKPIKAKPAKIAKIKKTQVRRHVWLSAKPVSHSNVVAFPVPAKRPTSLAACPAAARTRRAA